MNEMSTGEARRVLIARALVTRPRALILDEPTVGLDVVAQHRFLDMVRGIAVRGTTIVFITHHVEEIIPEVEHVILLKDGRVMDAGSKAAMLTDERLRVSLRWARSRRQDDGYFHVTTYGSQSAQS